MENMRIVITESRALTALEDTLTPFCGWRILWWRWMVGGKGRWGWGCHLVEERAKP